MGKQAFIDQDGAITFEGVSAEELKELAGDLLGEPSEPRYDWHAVCGDGPWWEGIEKVEWLDVDSGLVCMVRKAHHGAWCGYVGVPRGHERWGTSLEENDDLDVHGGVNYGAECDGDPENGICHVPSPGDPDDLWWIGFSCTTVWDYIPLYDRDDRDAVVQKPYKNLAYIQAETVRLAGQLKS